MSPPQTQFSRQDVLEAALQVTRESGLKELSARHIADRLGCSTAPVYSSFASMAELEREVITQARDLLLDYTRRPYTDQTFLNMGLGFAIFSREEKQLFRTLFMESSQHHEIMEEFGKAMLAQMALDPQYSQMDEPSRHRLLYKMWIFTHGLACLICVGWLDDDSDEHIRSLLMEVGSQIIAATFLKANADTHDPKKKVIF